MWANVNASWLKIIYCIKSFKMKYYLGEGLTGSPKASGGGGILTKPWRSELICEYFPMLCSSTNNRWKALLCCVWQLCCKYPYRGQQPALKIPEKFTISSHKPAPAHHRSINFNLDNPCYELKYCIWNWKVPTVSILKGMLQWRKSGLGKRTRQSLKDSELTSVRRVMITPKKTMPPSECLWVLAVWWVLADLT